MLVKNTVIALMAVAPALSLAVRPIGSTPDANRMVKVAAGNPGPMNTRIAADLKALELDEQGLERATMRMRTPGSKSLLPPHHHRHRHQQQHSTQAKSKHPGTHLRIETDDRMYKHSNAGLTPGSAGTTGSSTPGPFSASSPRTPNTPWGVSPGLQTYSRPNSPYSTDGTGDRGSMTLSPGSPQALTRRSVTPPSGHTTVHSHIADVMRFAGLVAQARKLLNGIETEAGIPTTKFQVVDSSRLKVHTPPADHATHATPSTPTTPTVKST